MNDMMFAPVHMTRLQKAEEATTLSAKAIEDPTNATIARCANPIKSR
jgi:hypothetical protein